MASDKVTFLEAATLIRQGVRPEDVGDMPYIGLEHIEEGKLRLLGVGSARDVTSTKSLFSKGDILFGKLRPYFRKVIRAPFDGICSTDIWVVRSKPGIEQDYLYYWMASQTFVDFATQGSEGTKMPRAKWDHVGRFQQVRLPETEQQAIAHILGTLDDKIELNHKMNETLEGMARAIFKSWFVDFDPVRAKAEGRQPSGIDPETAALFPDSFQDSPLGKIPKGWSTTKVSDFANVTSGKRPSQRSKERRDEFVFPLYGGGGVMAFVSEPMLSIPFLLTGRVGTLGKIFRITEKCWPSDNTLLLIPLEESYLGFLYFVLHGIDFDSLNRGSTQPLVTQTDLKNQKTIDPGNEILGVYHEHANCIFNKIDNNISQSSTLTAIRDALLPKLLSGEIRVKDAEKFVEEVA